MAADARIGQRRSYDGVLCTVWYIGQVEGTTGSWLGVEWDDPTRGKHDGHHRGVRYFSCKSTSPTAASFIRPTRPQDAPQTFVSALQLKYASEVTADQRPIATQKQVIISGKVAEEVGFDKIRRKLAQLSELQIVILDGSHIAYASPPNGQDAEQPISHVCPKVTELDLSHNLLERFETVVDICSELGSLRSLRVSGNRFQNVLEDSKLQSAEEVFKGVGELAVDETTLEWHEICHIASKFPSLRTLYSSANQLSRLSLIPIASFASTLVSVRLEFNDFTSLADIAALAAIPSLRNLHLKRNRISVITSSPSDKAPVFTSNLQYLDASYNQVASWSFVDSLPLSFPGLTALRFSHNPIYENAELDSQDPAGSRENKGSKTDKAYMLLVARLPALQTLNFSTVTPADRADAEMFYLSHIARQLAAVPEADEHTVLSRHRRWAELCELYGEPSVIRHAEVNPNFLEGRLIDVQFYLSTTSQDTSHTPQDLARRDAKIPKSFDLYTVKGIAGKLFGLPPLKLRLIWETGEWDPVAGFDDEAGDSSEEEELEEERERAEEKTKSGSPAEKKGGRWVKREVELKDGPRHFGYCVDGLEVKIRAEMR
ncbi:RNI-like protein [Lasiosphaeria miniovina]|uniref:RNI-like protein n=1 Tax=Lasiosphaeria miniovina TaxID=1954250 RepID=A0AA40EGP7_9PEZI|nr:RNI-like protein [Lasiosphaeria miniovina]KAK0734883.1 RNI-like protein [Lasiosphaeria miniovina]